MNRFAQAALCIVAFLTCGISFLVVASATTRELTNTELSSVVGGQLDPCDTVVTTKPTLRCTPGSGGQSCTEWCETPCTTRPNKTQCLSGNYICLSCNPADPPREVDVCETVAGKGGCVEHGSTAAGPCGRKIKKACLWIGPESTTTPCVCGPVPIEIDEQCARKDCSNT